MKYKFKLHCFHFFVIFRRMTEVMDLLYAIDNSNLPDVHKNTAWQHFSDSLIQMFINIYKDWNKAKDVCTDPEMIDSMDICFKQVFKRYPDMEVYRNQILSHAFGELHGPNKGSIFEKTRWRFYDIPSDKSETENLYLHVFNLSKHLQGAYADFWNDFKDGRFP